MLLPACFPLLLATAFQGGPTDGQAGAPLAARVNRAIARGAAYLQSGQRPDGHWSGYEADHPGGITALTALALLKSGVPPQDAGLAKALAAVEATEFRSVYSSAVHLVLLEALPPSSPRRARAAAEQRFLLDCQVGGMWGQKGYPGQHNDLSNTIFALLGLRAASRLDCPPPPQSLVECAKSLFSYQARDGGFAYLPDQLPSSGMTAAALGALWILEDLGGGDAALRALLRRRSRERQEALAWLERDFRSERNGLGERWTASWQYPYLWAVERWCGWSGRAEVGGQDWYRQGAEWLVERQNPDGSWSLDGSRIRENSCFALLFLRRASVTPEPAAAPLAVAAAAGPAPPLQPDGQVPWITRWWLAGPWRGGLKDDWIRAPPFDSRKLEPKPNGRVAKESWRLVELKSPGWTDLEDLTGASGDRLAWLLASWIDCSAPEPLDAFLWFSFEDGWRVWLDGTELDASDRAASPIVEDVRVALRLAPGRHLLAVLCEDLGGASAFSARLSDARGRPLPAAAVQVGPEPGPAVKGGGG